jgi:hypothetical protein
VSRLLFCCVGFSALAGCSHSEFKRGDDFRTALKRCGAQYEEFAWYPHFDGGMDFHADPTKSPIPGKAACMKRWASAQRNVTFEETQY